MLTVSVALWFVIVYSTWIATLGNPLYRQVAEADATLLTRADAVTTGELQDVTEDEVRFLQRFSRLGLMELAMVLVEVSVFGFLWWVDRSPVLSLGLFAKDFAMLGLSAVVAHIYTGEGIFLALLGLPRWIVVADRLSAAASAVGALILLLAINGFPIW